MTQEPRGGTDRRRTAPLRHPRLVREALTLEHMVRLYCASHHQAGAGPCAHCGELLVYARGRLAACVFGAAKPTCRKCAVHCYSRDRREQVRRVMRFAGPRMLWRHPLLAVRHLLDGWMGTGPRPDPSPRASGGRR